MNKRTFLKNSSLLTIGTLASFSALGKMVKTIAHLSPEAAAKDDTFWAMIREAYYLKPDYINLENGYYCIMPQEVLEQYFDHIREVNRQGAYYMRTVQFDNKNIAAAKLAELAGCAADELIITRNTTESLNMIISGINWQPGYEAIMASHDYGAMLDMFRQVSKRYGMVNKVLTVPMDPGSDDEIVEL